MKAAAEPYRFRLDRSEASTLEFETAEGVFVPTHTSQLLIQAARQSIERPGRLLDLGCGVGVCGIVLAKLGLCRPPVCASDLSERGVEVAQRNARAHGVEAIIRPGSLFAPWAGETFDVIVDDISAVCEPVARLSSWFPNGVDCDSGPDGTALTLQVLQDAPRHLAPGGRLLFPTLSLSCEARILKAARAAFLDVSLVSTQSWFLPEELAAHLDALEQLRASGVITLESKFGAWLWSTSIYQASRPR